MAGNYTHRNLIVWQRAQELGYQVSKLTQRLPQSWANAVISSEGMDEPPFPFLLEDYV